MTYLMTDKGVHEQKVESQSQGGVHEQKKVESQGQGSVHEQKGVESRGQGGVHEQKVDSHKAKEVFTNRR